MSDLPLPPSAPGFPACELRDPQELRAVAHPLRLRLLEELFLDGPATATELAERVGESPANCSWHLRQLARYGYVAEAGGGTGRQRPWRAIVRGHRSLPGRASRELARANDEVSEALFGREYEAMRGWHAGRHEEPPQWRDAGFVTQLLGWLTAEELAEVNREVMALLLRHRERITDAASRPPGARPVRFVAWGVPARPPAE